MLNSAMFTVLFSLFFFKVALSAGDEGTIYRLSGQPLTLNCTIEAKAVIEWAYNGEKLKIDSNDEFEDSQKIDGDATFGELLIKSPRLPNSGNYACNKQGNASVAKQYAVTIISIVGENKTINGTDQESVELQCAVENQNLSYSFISWKQNNTVIENGTENKKKYMITGDSKNTILTINKPVVKDAGPYTCVVKFTDLKQEFTYTVAIYVAPEVSIKKEPRGKVEGDEVTIICDVLGYPTPAVTWWKIQENNDPELVVYDDVPGRVTAKAHNSVSNAALIIKDLKIKTDRAKYKCSAENELGTANVTIHLKVKDRLAAVWPFLGICAEVIILCVVIFIFEKRRNKKMEEETEVDAVKQELMNHANGTADDRELELRQRQSSLPKS